MSTRSVRWAAGGVLLLAAVMLLAAMTAPARAVSPSELLEKAIYTEETVGNLDEAMKLYEEVISLAQTGQEVAAQAQYRLGMCHLKQGDDAAAKSAFETLIKEFPNAKDLIAKAQRHLPGALELLPAPWTDGERLQFHIKLPTGVEIGTKIYMIEAATHNGQDVTRCSTRDVITANDQTNYSEVLCEPESFKPLESVWRHSVLGETRGVYGDESVDVNVVGKDKQFTIDFTPPAFDNEQAAELFRRLPLAVGYKTAITIVTTLGGQKFDLPLSVPEIESITVPAGTFECFKLELGVVNQTFWISTDKHRYLVRFAAGGISADLVKIAQAAPGEMETVRGEDFSLTLPAGWLSYAPSSRSSDETTTRVHLLDPRADGRSEMVLRPKSMLDEAERASSKAWTEDFVSDLKKRYADLEVREPGLVETKVGGLPATLIVADYTKDGKQVSMVGVAVIGEKSAANLHLTTDAAKLDHLRPEFEAIVDSFQLK
jgi:hypothetical protein